MTFKYENLQLLKSPQNNVTSYIAITEKNKASQTYHICHNHFHNILRPFYGLLNFLFTTSELLHYYL